MLLYELYVKDTYLKVMPMRPNCNKKTKQANTSQTNFALNFVTTSSVLWLKF